MVIITVGLCVLRMVLVTVSTGCSRESVDQEHSNAAEESPAAELGRRGNSIFSVVLLGWQNASLPSNCEKNKFPKCQCEIRFSQKEYR